MKALVPALLACAACTQPPADASPFERPARLAYATPRADLRVWPADAELLAWALTAAPRLERATGLVVAVVDGEQVPYDSVPMFWSARGSDEGWMGITHEGGSDFIALDLTTPLQLREAVVLHEVLHALGAEHVPSGEGVLSPELWVRAEGWSLTEADLGRVCAAQSCSRMAAEE